jgi:hypothetical protein
VLRRTPQSSVYRAELNKCISISTVTSIKMTVVGVCRATCVVKMKMNRRTKFHREYLKMLYRFRDKSVHLDRKESGNKAVSSAHAV